MIENYYCEFCFEKHDHFIELETDEIIEIECTKCHMITGMLKEDL
jgi:hypothetical protein